MGDVDTVVDAALGEKGKSYAAHRDCSGFTAWAYRQAGVTIPEGSVAQYSVGHGVPVRDLQAGDLVFWDTFGPSPGHVALAINPSQVIHAINPERGIIVSDLHANMGGPMVGVRRVLDGTGHDISQEKPPKKEKPNRPKGGGGKGATPVPDPPAQTAWTPKIYDLRNDTHAAQFGLAPWQRDQILQKKIDGRGGGRPEVIGLHVQWGNTPGSLGYWLGVAASATIALQSDGSILKIIPEADGPWTQGDVRGPDAQVRKLIQRYGPDPNVYSLTIEAEDHRTEDINDVQAQSIVWQIRQWWATYPWLADADWRDRIVGHYQINSGPPPEGRERCGRYRDRIIKMLAAAVPAPQPLPGFVGLPPWLPADFFRAAFPLADPAGAVTKRLIAWIATTGRVPYFIEKIDVGAGRNIWRFDILTMLSDGAAVWIEGEKR